MSHKSPPARVFLKTFCHNYKKNIKQKQIHFCHYVRNHSYQFPQKNAKKRIFFRHVVVLLPDFLRTPRLSFVKFTCPAAFQAAWIVKLSSKKRACFSRLALKSIRHYFSPLPLYKKSLLNHPGT